MSLQSSILSATKTIQNADAFLITAGAGMGVDSGLPDYRGVNGLWTSKIHQNGKDVAGDIFSNPHLFTSDPDTAWISRRYWQQRDRFLAWQQQMHNKNIAVIEIGAGSTIPTIRSESEFFNGQHIRINLHEAEGHKDTIAIPMGALDALQAIDNVASTIA